MGSKVPRDREKITPRLIAQMVSGPSHLIRDLRMEYLGALRVPTPLDHMWKVRELDVTPDSWVSFPPETGSKNSH